MSRETGNRPAERDHARDRPAGRSGSICACCTSCGSDQPPLARRRRLEIRSSGQSGSCKRPVEQKRRETRHDRPGLRAARHHEAGLELGEGARGLRVGRQGARGHHFQHARQRETGRPPDRCARRPAARCAPSRPPRRGRTSREPLPPSSPARSRGQHAGLRPVGAQRAAASGHMARRGRGRRRGRPVRPAGAAGRPGPGG
jgi:hypothetical protein